MLRKRLGMILGIIFTLMLNVSQAQAADYTENWAGHQITAWMSQGKVQGYSDGNFRPDDNVTRGEFVTLVNRSFGFEKTKGSNFSDVSQKAWYSQEISKALAAGYISGYPEGSFRPELTISRQEVAVILAKVLKFKTDSHTTVQFSDSSQLRPWSSGAVDKMTAAGYIKGYADNTFRPIQPISRAEAVVVLDRVVTGTSNTTTYDKEATFGPADTTQNITGNLVISAPGVIVRNTTITGNLVLAEGIGDGEVTLNGVIVKGNTLVAGGGAHSIVFNNCSVPSLSVKKKGVRVIASGSSSVKSVWLESEATLTEQNATGVGFYTIILSRALPAGSNVTLNGSFTQVHLSGPQVRLDIESGKVSNLTVATTATGAEVNIAAAASVGSADIQAASSITGQGLVESASIKVPGVSLQQKPTNLVTADKVTVNVGGVITNNPTGSPTTGSNNGSGSGTGTGGGTSPLSLEGAYLTTVTGHSSTTGDVVANNHNVPANPTIKLVFDRGMLENWTNNSSCISLLDQSGNSLAINVQAILAADDPDESEKRTVFLVPQNSLSQGATFRIVISPNIKANNGNTLGVEQVITFSVQQVSGGGGGNTPDTTPPLFVGGYPQVSNIQYNQANLLMKSNEAGQGYYVVLSGQGSAPSTAQVKAGLDAEGNALPVNMHGTLNLSANTENSVLIAGLSATTSYVVYAIAEDVAGNLQAGVAQVNLLTISQPVQQDQSTATVTLQSAGNKTAGTSFNLNINGATSSQGMSLSGNVTVVVTSNVDGNIFNGSVLFSAGTATLAIPSATVVTAGSQNLTVLIAGVTQAQTVDVTVVPATQISALKSSVTIDQPLARATTSRLTVTLRDTFNNPMINTSKNLKIAVAITNNGPTSESYIVDGNTLAATPALPLDRTNAATDAFGRVYYDVYLPATIDPGDGIDLQITQNNGTAIGSVYSYNALDESSAGVTLAIGGSKPAGSTIALNLSGGKDQNGDYLEGSAGVTITSDIDGSVFNGSATFSSGAATINIATGKVITAGNQTLTVQVTGVTQPQTLEVTVVAASSISSANSMVTIDQALAKGTTSRLTVTLRDAYNNLMINATKSLKLAVSVVNNGPTVEDYQVDGTVVTASVTLTRSSAATDSNGCVYYEVILPATIDSGDSITVQVTQNSGTVIPSASVIYYLEP